MTRRKCSKNLAATISTISSVSLPCAPGVEFSAAHSKHLTDLRRVDVSGSMNSRRLERRIKRTSPGEAVPRATAARRACSPRAWVKTLWSDDTWVFCSKLKTSTFWGMEGTDLWSGRSRALSQEATMLLRLTLKCSEASGAFLIFLRTMLLYQLWCCVAVPLMLLWGFLLCCCAAAVLLCCCCDVVLLLWCRAAVLPCCCAAVRLLYTALLMCCRPACCCAEVLPFFRAAVYCCGVVLLWWLLLC